jgi:hypothetical protein
LGPELAASDRDVIFSLLINQLNQLSQLHNRVKMFPRLQNMEFCGTIRLFESKELKLFY